MNEHKYQEIFIWQKGQENAAKSQEEEFFKIVFLSGLQGVRQWNSKYGIFELWDQPLWREGKEINNREHKLFEDMSISL